MVSPVLFVAVPLGVAFLIVLIGTGGAARTLALISTTGLIALAGSWLIPAVTAPTTVVLGGVSAPLGIAFGIDPFSAAMALLVAVSLFLVTVYSLGYIPAGAGLHTTHRPDEMRYYAVLMLLAAASFGLLLTRDLFNLFVFYEILCISSYILVSFEQDDRALEASMKYMLLGSVGSLFMLVAIGLAYRASGSLAMSDVAAAMAVAPKPYVLITAVLFLFGMGLEAAIFPVNTWLPDAHSSAPSSISAVLSGFVIELALVVLVRIGMTVFATVPLLQILQFLAIAGIIVGEMAAWSQQELKRTLAYSSIGQIGIILFALSLGTEVGVQAALGHIVMHAGAKSVLFLIAGYFILRTGSRMIDDYRGIARKMPVSTVIFVIAALSLLGVPPLFGFFTKFRVIAAAAVTAVSATAGGAATNAGGGVIAGGGFIAGGAVPGVVWFGIAAILFGTVLEGAYLFRIVRILFEHTGEEVTRREDLDLPAMIAVSIFVLIVVVGSVFLPVIDRVIQPAAAALAVLL